jgi:hypothetical protein
VGFESSTAGAVAGACAAGVTGGRCTCAAGCARISRQGSLRAARCRYQKSRFGAQGISLRSAGVDTSSMCRNAGAIFWI